ncbi:NAD(P)/FAD-dependent oxidoreductase [Nonomuraea sp. NPDC005650]|uniref:NAD(P)/FAD-dependent oxidoreductase n=1 Tax=Nonomuraea sp. NPDC005650 TaxID=3157045 RepID=UPI00339DB40D
MTATDRLGDLDADVLIVGAGPSGLYAAYYAGLRELSVVLLDSLPEPGGQLMALYPQKPIYDVAGLPAVTGAELTRALTVQAEVASPAWVLGEQAMALLRNPPGPGRRFTVTTDQGRRMCIDGVVIAAGIGSFQPRRLDAAEPHLGCGFTYSLGDLAAYRDRDVVIVGGGDSAVDWSLMVEPVARSLTVVHRRRILRAHPRSVSRLRQSRARILLDSEVIATHGENHLEAVAVRHRNGTERRFPAGALIAALGHTATLGPLATWGFELSGRQIVVDERMATTLPGVFAIGDVTAHRGKVRIMAVGFGEAATAVNNLAAELRPGEPVFPGHSTDLMATATIPEPR